MKKTITFFLLAMFFTFQAFSQGILVNHTCTKIVQIPEAAIIAAKQNLHIAYGHTSHGSQLTDGMTGLVTFMNGLGHTNDLYDWNNGGTGGALDLHDYAMDGDVGYYPDWVDNTRAYLGTVNPSTGRGTGANQDVNVIIWSWCGQIEEKYTAGTLMSEYINPMVQLETDYFGIKFVYMTGHLDYWDEANNKAANQVVRDFCINNNKILYDFADIESWDPDSIYYEHAGDDCSYYSAGGDSLGNWAAEWQNSHTVDVDWYNCTSQHSEPLNANQKAYAAWWLWAWLGGWDPAGITETENNSQEIAVFPNPVTDNISIIVPEKSKIEILNVEGQLLKTILARGIETTVFSDDLASGIYFIRATTENKIITKRFIKE
ncbi:MAG TPA: T9SS type A sorting domain-containing protein [Bacteroidales bacterium]|nr:T9SS type A sorting domain-containing protein [Bacteroidales bacterium]